MIEADSLVKRYGSFEAVRGVSFRVERGQVVGLLGPNGAGKTSIMRILTCYHFPTAGTARVDGHDVSAQPAPGAPGRWATFPRMLPCTTT